MTHKRKRSTRRLVRAFGEVQRAQAALRRIVPCPSRDPDIDVPCDLTIGHVGQVKHRHRVLGTQAVFTW